MPSKKDSTLSPAYTQLPAKKNREEADLGKRVAEKLRTVHEHPNWVMELKTAKGRLKDHQARALRKVEDGDFLYKIPDMGQRNPFDYVCLGDADAIVCVLGEKKSVVCSVNDGAITHKFSI